MPKPAPGIELRGDKVAALKAGGGPLPVSAAYFGHNSNRVVFKSVEADPNLTLRVDVDRTLRLAGEPGQLALAATCPRGDVELVPEMADFTSSDAGVIKVDAKQGDFQAGAPGEVDHHRQPCRGQAAGDAETARLRSGQGTAGLRPGRGRALAVHEQAAAAAVPGSPGGGKTAAGGDGRAGHRLLGRPSPTPCGGRRRCWLGWPPPSRSPLTAGYAPYLKSTATAQVEVLPAAEPAGLRVVPSTASLAAGQTVSLAVQQQLPGSEQWKEVRPDAVSWTVPSEAIWSRPASRCGRP